MAQKFVKILFRNTQKMHLFHTPVYVPIPPEKDNHL